MLYNVFEDDIMNGSHLQRNINIKNNYEIIEYIKPQIIYIPLEDKNGHKYKHLIKEGEYIYKGDIVAVDEENNFPLHSSVSGYVIVGTKKIINNGKKIKCIVVENDFKEKYREKLGFKRNLANYSKEEFLKMLFNCGIMGLGGIGDITYLKYNNAKKINYLIVNAMECEPYITCDKALIKKHIEDILEGIDAIIEIMKIKKAIIVINEQDYQSITQISKFIGTYPNIKLFVLPNFYPNGWEHYLVRKVIGLDYKNSPREVGVIVNNIATIYAIYEMLKYNRPLTERVITITGTGVKKAVNVKVKIGALLSEVITNLDILKKDNQDNLFIAGGLMMGKSLPTDEVIITKDLNAVMIIKNQLPKTKECINCGACSNVCPASLIPVEIMRNCENKKMCKILKANKCIECGLCSYICPSKIEVREYVKIAKQKVKE